MYSEFEKWLDNVLDNATLPSDGVAVNFNIYEEGDDEWSVQIILASRFDSEDMDWACDEVFSSEEDIYIWKQETSWEEVVVSANEWICKYLESGKHAETLKSYEAVGAGFIDGIIEILYPVSESELPEEDEA